MQNMDEVLPDGVDLRDWEDSDTLRGQIFDGVAEEVTNSFPKSFGGVTLNISDVNYADKDYYSLAEQKKAILTNKYLTRRLRGKLTLTDDKTGEVLDEEVKTLMKVPYMTPRGTFIHNGNEYSTINQARLRSGIYARKKSSGDIEAHVNAERGRGNSFHIRMEPRTGLFKLDIGQAQLHLYSLLKSIGVEDDVVENAWGTELYEINKNKYDARVFQKAYDRLLGRKAKKDASQEEKIQAIKDAIQSTQVETATLKKTLPNF
jgi:DNA-directed RNA polymerase beta subunit